MSDKIIDMKDRVKPARVTDHDTGTVYELDFTRAEGLRYHRRTEPPGDRAGRPVLLCVPKEP